MSKAEGNHRNSTRKQTSDYGTWEIQAVGRKAAKRPICVNRARGVDEGSAVVQWLGMQNANTWNKFPSFNYCCSLWLPSHLRLPALEPSLSASGHFCTRCWRKPTQAQRVCCRAASVQEAVPSDCKTLGATNSLAQQVCGWQAWWSNALPRVSSTTAKPHDPTATGPLDLLGE